MNIVHHSTAQVVPLHRGSAAEALLPLCEALLFTAGKPLTVEQIAESTGAKPEAVRWALVKLAARMEAADRGLCIAWVGPAAQLIAKPQYHHAIDTARRTDGDRLVLVVREYIQAQRLRGRRPKTLEAYQQFLERFVRTVGKPVDEITVRDIRMFLMAEEARGNKRNTIGTKVVKFRSFFKWLEREEYIERNPMAKIDPPAEDKSPPKFLTHEEIERLRDACRRPIERLLLEVLYSSGIRVSEAVALDWDDVNLDGKHLTVREGKGGKARHAPLSTRAVMLLRQERERRRDSNPWVFQSQFKRRMAKETIERTMRVLGERAGLRERLTPHRLRHSLATHLLAAGAPIDVVQHILGHESIKTTTVYARTQQATVEQHYRRVFP